MRVPNRDALGHIVKKTRFSLIYLAAYLLAGGIGLLLAPQLALKLLLTTGDYGHVFPRFVGMFMIGLGLIVVQIIRHDIAVLYPTTLVVRVFFIACMGGFYLATADPLFLVLIAIVGLGVIFTGWSYLGERRAAKP